MGLFGLFKNKAEESVEEVKEEVKPRYKLCNFKFNFVNLDDEQEMILFLVEDDAGNRLWRGRGTQEAVMELTSTEENAEYVDISIYSVEGNEKTLLSEETISIKDVKGVSMSYSYKFHYTLKMSSSGKEIWYLDKEKIVLDCAPV